MRIIPMCLVVACLAGGVAAAEPVFVDAAAVLEARLGHAWRCSAPETLAREIVALAESLPIGGAIDLPDDVTVGELDFRRVADDVQVTGGCGGPLVLGGGQRGIHMLFTRLDLRVDAGRPRPPGRSREAAVAAGRFQHGVPVRLVAAGFADQRVLDPAARPLSDLLALFCEGKIAVQEDVRHCSWICGGNA